MDVENLTVLYGLRPGGHIGFIIVKSLCNNIVLILTYLTPKIEENGFQNGWLIGSQRSEFQDALWPWKLGQGHDPSVCDNNFVRCINCENGVLIAQFMTEI